jgi:hypothetical protein
LNQVPYIKPGIYRHYKGTQYRVFGTALHTEYAICFVVYGKDKVEWARPYSDFVEIVEVDGEKVPQFQFLGD